MNLAEKLQKFLDRNAELISSYPFPQGWCGRGAGERECFLGMRPAEKAAEEVGLPAWVFSCEPSKKCSHDFLKLRLKPRVFFACVRDACTDPADRASMDALIEHRNSEYAASVAEAQRIFGPLPSKRNVE